MYIACEDCDFDWTEEEVQLVDELYKAGEDIKVLAKTVGRPIEELIVLLIDRSNKKKLNFRIDKFIEKPKKEYKDPSFTKEVYLELKKSRLSEDNIKLLLGIGSERFMEMKKRWGLNYYSRYPTQEQYESEKRRGLSDREVCKGYRMSEKTLYKIKRIWGLL